jgi:spermidine synthase
VVALGFAAAVAQAVLLREAMAAMGGSELAWGSVMALWLLGMGVGARAGVRWGGAELARWLPLAVVLLSGIGVILFRAAPALTGAAPGETITTWHSLWLWAAAVLPAAVAGGIAFPILAARLGFGGAGSAYSSEAFGALAGGLALSLALAPLGSAAALCVTASLVSAFTLLRNGRAVAAAAAAVGLAATVFAGDLLAVAGWRWAGHPGELDRWRETRHQRVEMSRGDQLSLYADGRLLASFPDPYGVVPRAHLTMLLHPRPERVLALGCLANGAVRTMAAHPVEEIVAIEEDPELIRIVPSWYGWTSDTTGGARVRTLAGDPIRALSRGGPWDLIVLNDGNPTTIRHNRSRTREFFRRCRDSMSEDGVLVIRLEVNDTYLGGAAGRLLKVMVSTLREVFPKVSGVPGEEVLLVAGRDRAELSLDAAELEARWSARGVHDPEFRPEILSLLVEPFRVETLGEVVAAAAAPINTVNHPRAVLLAAGLLEARSRTSLLRVSSYLEGRSAWPLAAAAALVALLLLVLSALPRPPASATSAVVGLLSMGWWLLLIASWQATRGSVYAEIGALNAAFMGGLAGGSLAATRWRHPVRQLPWVLIGGVMVSIAIAFHVPMRLPVLLIPALLVLAGGLTGAAFPGIAELAGRGQERRGAGIAFAADEAGAACAALVVGILALPWAGLAATAGGLAIISLAAIPAVMIRLRRAE